MKIRIVKVGKPAFVETRALCQEYEKRSRTFARCEGVEVKGDLSADFLAKAQDKGGVVVILDERGEAWSSPSLAKRVGTWRDDPRIKSLTFVIGGPFGIPEAMRQNADALWSLSAATLPSDLAWVLCWEQVYRAFNILHGTSYHHG